MEAVDCTPVLPQASQLSWGIWIESRLISLSGTKISAAWMTRKSATQIQYHPQTMLPITGVESTSCMFAPHSYFLIYVRYCSDHLLNLSRDSNRAGLYDTYDSIVCFSIKAISYSRMISEMIFCPFPNFQLPINSTTVQTATHHSKVQITNLEGSTQHQDVMECPESYPLFLKLTILCEWDDTNWTIWGSTSQNESNLMWCKRQAVHWGCVQKRHMDLHKQVSVIS